MITAEIPDNEEHRLRRLIELDILDTLEEEAYDDLTRLAAELCDTPIALVSLIDRNRQWFKSHYGLDARETPRDFAFCAHAILGDDIFVIEDSSKDERFFDNPLATGEPHVKFYAGAPLIMSDNSRLGTLCVIGSEARSISTSQKQALAALARQVVSQLELRLKVKELEMLDQAKDEFISIVSHELRTPLTAIHGSLSLVLNGVTGELNQKQKNLIDISYRNSERLICLVNDILDVAKLESGKLELELKNILMVDLLQKAIELNEQYCQRCHIKVNMSFPENLKNTSIMGDEQRLLQVITNVLSNAAKFTHENDVVEIDFKIKDNFAVVEITDHGPGISPEDQNKLFKKFSQINTEANGTLPGTGLGLSICKKIMGLHRGEIGVNSIPGTETTFYISLPLSGQ